MSGPPRLSQPSAPRLSPAYVSRPRRLLPVVAKSPGSVVEAQDRAVWGSRCRSFSAFPRLFPALCPGSSLTAACGAAAASDASTIVPIGAARAGSWVAPASGSFARRLPIDWNSRQVPPALLRPPRLRPVRSGLGEDEVLPLETSFKPSRPLICALVERRVVNGEVERPPIGWIKIGLDSYVDPDDFNIRPFCGQSPSRTRAQSGAERLHFCATQC